MSDRGIVIGYPEDRWEPYEPRVELIDGPERIYDANPKPDTMRRPVGFGVIPTPVEVEPRLWDGDQA